MKIPIKITQVNTGNKLKNVIIFNSTDYFELKHDSTLKIKKFEKLYSDVVEKISNIKGEKYGALSSSKYYELGVILKNFNTKKEHDFEIKNKFLIHDHLLLHNQDNLLLELPIQSILK